MTYKEATNRIRHDDRTAVRAALEKGMDPNLRNRLGWTLLMIAAMEGIVSMGVLLVQAGANPDLKNHFGETALSLAIHNVHPAFVRMLFVQGASFESVRDFSDRRGLAAQMLPEY